MISTIILHDPSVATLLLICYVVSALITKRLIFLLAFLLSEFYGNCVIFDILPNVAYYLGYASIYCLLYFWCYQTKEKIKTLFAVMLIILLDIGSAIDAGLYPDSETIFYQSYPILLIFVHIHLISKFVNWQILRLNLGYSANNVLSLLGASYSITFFWYTIHNLYKKDFTSCH